MEDGISSLKLEDIQSSAMELVARMPSLMFEARKASHIVAHGIHGRKRAGPGDTFWQFRKFVTGDYVSQIDWRRSASSQSLFIREKEWEAAHTIWLWPDLSPSMIFRSRLSNHSKRERGLMLMLALSQLLVNAGERVGVVGRSAPTASRNVIGKLSETVMLELQREPVQDALPPNVNLNALSECVIFSDCLEPLDHLMDRVQMIAGQGVRGHVVQVLDPVEESFPFKGRTEFHMHGDQGHLTISRAENIRDAYRRRLQALKGELKTTLHRMNWSFLVHHTDRPASDLLLTLYNCISGEGHASAQMRDGSDEDYLTGGAE